MSVKRVVALALVLCMVFAVAGCSSKSSISYTYNVNNGDKIKITLNTSTGYSMDSKTPFSISKDGEVISQGTFIVASAYGDMYDAVVADENAELFEEKDGDDITYFAWKYESGDSSEFNYCILVNGSETGIVLGNIISQESAKEVFGLLTYSVE